MSDLGETSGDFYVGGLLCGIPLIKDRSHFVGMACAEMTSGSDQSTVSIVSLSQSSRETCSKQVLSITEIFPIDFRTFSMRFGRVYQ